MRAAAAALAVLLAGCGGAAPGVLEVRVGDHDATAFGVGDGRAVTVAHVLRAGQPVFVGGQRARVLRVDRRLDVALLAVAGVRAPARRGEAGARGPAAGRGGRRGGGGAGGAAGGRGSNAPPRRGGGPPARPGAPGLT